MPLFQSRPAAALDAELRALCDVIRGASRELTEVRRRQAELVDMEAALIVAIDVRMRRVDDLLDQRCQVAGVGHRRTTGSTAGQGIAGLRTADGSDHRSVQVPGPISASG